MHGAAKPKIRKVKRGHQCWSRQGEKGSDVYLILDGVLRVEVDGERLAEYGPGALLGERAHLEGGTRTSTPRRGDPVPGRLGARRGPRSRGTRGAVDRTPPRRHERGLTACGSTSWACEARRPHPASSFVRYGGYTSCVAIAHDGDAAPTLAPRLPARGFGARARSAAATAFPGTILLSHLHWDHVHGLPFFSGRRSRRLARRRSSCPTSSTARAPSRCSRVACRLRTSPFGPDELRGKLDLHDARAGRASRSRASRGRRRRSPTRADAPTATA